jgi:hypothetical protein
MRWLIAAAFLAVLSPALWAQGHSRGTASPSGWSPWPVAPARGLTVSPAHSRQPGFPHHLGPGVVFLGNPWLTTYEPLNTQPAASPVIVLETPAVPRPSPAEPAKSAEPLLIELRGNRYVRVVDASTTDAPQRGIGTPEEAAANIKPVELPPTVLIFRDGHREQLNEYSIIDSTLYTTGDYWQSGSWTRKVPLSTLDLGATTAANRDAGVKFVLPTGPNMVVTRP